jgi:hypothetical protein
MIGSLPPDASSAGSREPVAITSFAASSLWLSVRPRAARGPVHEQGESGLRAASVGGCTYVRFRAFRGTWSAHFAPVRGQAGFRHSDPDGGTPGLGSSRWGSDGRGRTTAVMNSDQSCRVTLNRVPMAYLFVVARRALSPCGPADG